MTPSGRGIEQRKYTVFFYRLMVKGLQQWQMENVIALECAIHQINSFYMAGEIIFFDWSRFLLFYQWKITAVILGFPEDNRCSL